MLPECCRLMFYYQEQGLETVFVRAHIVNILGVAATQLCCYNSKAAMDNM